MAARQQPRTYPKDRAASSNARRRGPGSHAAEGPLRMHWGRLAALALVLIAGALYVGPLRDFFAQQDRYQRELASVNQLKTENAAFEAQLKAMHSSDWVVRQAREEFGLIPPGMQAFVITGLPDENAQRRAQSSPQDQSLSLLDRLKDLWTTLLQ